MGKQMSKDEMLYIASKYVSKGYSIDQMRDGDDCYNLTGEDGEVIKDEIAEYMEELYNMGRISFYEKYKQFKLYPY